MIFIYFVSKNQCNNKKYIKKFRRAKGISQENLAKAINKTSTTIVRYEEGEIVPNAEQIYLICQELGILIMTKNCKY